MAHHDVNTFFSMKEGHMPRYWIVSANVNNKPGTLRRWIDAILLNKSAYMGWKPDSHTGRVFRKIASGDVALICGSLANHGAQRRLVACGKVLTNRATRDSRVGDLGGQNQFVTLTNFRTLDEDPKKCGLHSEIHFATTTHSRLLFLK
jgi:hypothetical protein